MHTGLMNCRPTQLTGGWWNLGGRSREEDFRAGSRPSPFPAGLPARTVTAALKACLVCHRGRRHAGFSHQVGLRFIFPSSWASAPLALSLHGKGRSSHLWVSRSGTGAYGTEAPPASLRRDENGHFLPALHIGAWGFSAQSLSYS